jgi:hypothetical protein
MKAKEEWQSSCSIPHLITQVTTSKSKNQILESRDELMEIVKEKRLVDLNLVSESKMVA